MYEGVGSHSKRVGGFIQKGVGVHSKRLGGSFKEGFSCGIFIGVHIHKREGVG